MLLFRIPDDNENDTGYHDRISKVVINEIRLENR